MKKDRECGLSAGAEQGVDVKPVLRRSAALEEIPEPGVGEAARERGLRADQRHATASRAALSARIWSSGE
mgnify:CR=1 FL=1